MNIKKYIPNFITLLNLSMGIGSIYFSNMGSGSALMYAGYLIFLAAIFDFFDGFAARLLNAKSDIGLQLDSLADMVSFGVAPGFILYKMIILSSASEILVINDFAVLPLIAILIPWGAALRLAKFNIDETQQMGFKGMPTPALAFFIASLPIIRETLIADQGLLFTVLTSPVLLVLTAIIGIFLMTSSFPMFALKFTTYKWKGNEFRFSFLLISLLLIAVLQIASIPLIIILYLAMSLMVVLTGK
jgi:CDP-diacylglycerol--serine O-phosphatidyltransferase